jgi:outer membrane lipopolysaccharide assembly protein LptE/RlpB
MNKKIFLSLVLVFLTGCGFTPMLKDFDVSKLNVQKITYSGKNDLTYLLKSSLNINETSSPRGMIVDISITEAISAETKNSSGVTTEENLIITIAIKIVDSKGNALLSDSDSSNRRLSVTNNLSSDEETRKIERNNLMRNLSQKIKLRLQMVAQQIK